MSYGFWQDTDFFKGFLTPRWRHRQMSYVILADLEEFSDDGLCCTSGRSINETTRTSTPIDIRTPSSQHSKSGREEKFVTSNPFSSPVVRPSHSSLKFYMFNREDVSPPSAKYITEPSKLDRCFFVCERENCDCPCLHVKKDAWRLRLDTMEQSVDLVCYAEDRIARVQRRDVSPTAGYYYSLGLLSQGVPCLFPRLCPCEEGCCPRSESCLFIHLDHGAGMIEPPIELSANHALSVLGGGISEEAKQILQLRRLETVGDMQILSKEAFDAFVGQAPQSLLGELLAVSTCRFFEPFSSLEKVLATFPNMPTDFQEEVKPFAKVADILKLSTSELYSVIVDTEIIKAFEVIRKRLEPDDPFTSLHLADFHPNSFILRAYHKIIETTKKYAHCSWRRHDPKRPVVSSMITFVDVENCCCRHTNRSSPSRGDVEGFDTVEVRTAKDNEDKYDWRDKELLPAPHGSWCECPRMWEVAVNYELNTPMGSRCSEQNAMGAIARTGVPTWAIREVVVHGNKGSSEMNPLFPCGVCENMLRKVDVDVRKYYGKPTVLYMFDATIPSRVLSMPIREISLRDNPRFKRLLESDTTKESYF